MPAMQTRVARGRGIVALTLGIAAALVLLAIGPRSAGAANPTLTASENPVVIPFGSNTKPISVNWNLNGVPKATLLISEQGGQGSSSIQVTTQTGSKPLTVTFGNSYTVSLLDVNNASLLASLQITTKRPANPTIAASENPVVIAYGSSSKGISLNWNLDGLASARLVLSENGGATLINTLVQAQNGSMPATVFYGKSYQAALKDAASNATLTSISITTARPQIQFPGGVLSCLVDLCITDVDFQPHGTYVEFDVKTSKDARFEIQASTDAPDANGTFAHVDSAMFNLAYVSDWHSMMLSLEPNTTYHYVLRAFTPGNAETAVKTGTFKTLKRRVQVTFDSITVIDDSDDLSACDCTFWFQAGGLNPKSYGEVSVSSGSTISPNVSFTLTNPADTIVVRVEGQDDDADFGQFCTNGTGPGWGNGSNSCMDWSSASKTIDVTSSGLGEVTTDAYTLTANGGPLVFTAHVTVAISYVP